jgi:hypothetical protein
VRGIFTHAVRLEHIESNPASDLAGDV